MTRHRHDCGHVHECAAPDPVTVVDRPDNGQDEGRVLIARCENYREDLDQPCTGTLRYRCGMIQAACDTCGGYCGVAVARWTEVTSGRAGAGEQQREQVADEHGKHSFHWMQQHPGWLARCDCWGWEEPLRDEEHAPAIHRRWRLHVAAELLALLGGPQPGGEARQHRMDADCWCQPVQADNGAWDHQ